jgi:seryl-tRNA synthetase
MLDITLPPQRPRSGAIARWKPAKIPRRFLNVEAFQALEAERKTIQTRTEELQASAMR